MAKQPVVDLIDVRIDRLMDRLDALEEGQQRSIESLDELIDRAKQPRPKLEVVKGGDGA